MASSIIDTLRYARRLKEAGVAPAQAEAMADALAVELVPNGRHGRPTSADAVSELKAWFKTELKAEIAVLEARLTWRLLGGVTGDRRPRSRADQARLSRDSQLHREPAPMPSSGVDTATEPADHPRVSSGIRPPTPRGAPPCFVISS